jgi:hypothetical protein
LKDNNANNARGLFLNVMSFKCPGTSLATLGGIWQTSLRRWADEGMPRELTDVGSLIDYLGLDHHTWCAPAAESFVYPHYPYGVVRETEDKVTYVNSQGITCTDFKQDAFTSMPHFEEFPVKSREDWAPHRQRLQWDPARVGEAWQRQIAGFRERPDVPVILAFGRGGSLYGSLRDMLGVEGLSYLFYDDPVLVEEMMDTMVELFLRVTDALLTDFVPDAVCLWEDMAYKTSSLLGVSQMREFMLPRYKAMTQKLREKGVPFILLDSDGYIGELIPIWLEAGIDGVVPMEAQAGMDVALYRDRYPQLLMMGGIDKKALAHGKDAIDLEMEKVAHVLQTGGYVPFFDHGLPHDVSCEDFLYYVERLKETTGREV